MKMTILIVIDSSEAALRTTHLAALLAAVADGSLVLVPVEAPLVTTPQMDLETIPPEYYAQQEHTQALAAEELSELLTVPVAVEHPVPSLYNVLDDLIARWHPQLLVLPLPPEHDLLDRLLLNQALPALRDAGLPLLLVPEQATLDPQLPQQVAIAADTEPFQLTAASRALRPLLTSWQAEYCVVHVAATDEADASINQAAQAVRTSGLLPARTVCRVYQGQHQPPSTGIVQAALDVQADLLVLPARPRSLAASVFGRGVAAHVARTCSVPLLLLPTLGLPVAGIRRPWRKPSTRAGRTAGHRGAHAARSGRAAAQPALPRK